MENYGSASQSTSFLHETDENADKSPTPKRDV